LIIIQVPSQQGLPQLALATATSDDQIALKDQEPIKLSITNHQPPVFYTKKILANIIRTLHHSQCSGLIRKLLRRFSKTVVRTIKEVIVDWNNLAIFTQYKIDPKPQTAVIQKEDQLFWINLHQKYLNRIKRVRTKRMVMLVVEMLVRTITLSQSFLHYSAVELSSTAMRQIVCKTYRSLIKRQLTCFCRISLLPPVSSRLIKKFNRVKRQVICHLMLHQQMFPIPTKT